MRFIRWIWEKGILSTFLTGLLTLLPLIITAALIGWVASFLMGIFGPDKPVGKAIRSLGMQFVDNTTLATLIGFLFVVALIWGVGVYSKWIARNQVSAALKSLADRLPVVNSVYGTAVQFVNLLQKDKESELSGMSVVFCSFGSEQNCGFLALLACPERFRICDRDYLVVYVPTSPVPMSGGVMFVPAEQVHTVDMTAEQLMRIYLTMGVTAGEAMPDSLKATSGKIESPAPS